MLRTYAIEIALGIALLLLSFFAPLFTVAGVGTLVTATSTVFALVAGFFIADAMANYLRLQTLIAEENAALVALADYAKVVDMENSGLVYQAIDDYMVAQLDTGTLSHTISTQKQIDVLDSAIHHLRVSPEGKTVFDHILSMQEKITSTRQEMALSSKRNLTSAHWLTLLFLGGLTGTSVLAIRDGSTTLNIIACLMLVGIMTILILLRDMDNNRLLERKLAYENPREVFHAIGRAPYYPAFSPARTRVPDEHGNRRVGPAR